MEGTNFKLGMDIGSTTIKMVVVSESNEIVYKIYRRHNADIGQALTDELKALSRRFPGGRFSLNITGSAGMGIAERAEIPFVQEVVASVEVTGRQYPQAKTLIDLGGEDAKMVFFEEGRQPDIRMNGSCAGGTGSFIDQMADLMNITVEELGIRALQGEKIYPVASRCGVFAKTDVQNLILRKVNIPDIALSILRAVALQSITTLARACTIRPPVVCTGGPLTFLPALRRAFQELLKLESAQFLVPENSEYFPAWGCALLNSDRLIDINLFIDRIRTKAGGQKEALPALFENAAEYREWKHGRKITPLKSRELTENETLNCFLGIDSGSTASKILVLDEKDNVVFDFYAANQGNPLRKVAEGLQKFYGPANRKGVKVNILGSCSTGYGEELIKSALNLDCGIVETAAHFAGAQYIDPEVSFVLDIGGQDMKSIFIGNGIISRIELNEACSSGCGSFLQNFAASMNMTLSQFSEAACMAESPADLGTRCTVFMNSKVKQSLRENASPDDIAAGLAYSVIRNCLFKVLKINNLNSLGEHIVVQGGTFRNDAVYRALEILSGKSIRSTDHPELMGALGAALYAKKMAKGRTAGGISPLNELHDIETKELTCKGCSNACTVLRFKFPNGNTCFSGNKCEKVFYSKSRAPKKGFNAFEMKNEMLFGSAPASHEEDVRERVGIPRVLNMYENYPFWKTLFEACGFRAVLSPESTFALYGKGAGCVMSDNLCFPAKLVQGHVLSLLEMGVGRIFYPIVVKEEKELENACNSFNCPVVSGYPDVIRSAVEPAENYGVPFDRPVITFHDRKALEKGCFRYLSALGVSRATFDRAFGKAMNERKRIKTELCERQKAMLDKLAAGNEPVFIVAGRPYHADPLIQQKIGQILSDLGASVLTDDVFLPEENSGFGRLNIVSQWAYPNRVVQAAMAVARLPRNVQLVQLNSFGCGPDSFFMDETGEILRQAGKNHTVLRIDEIASPGSVRLRLRSLMESLHGALPAENHTYAGYAAAYAGKDRQKTILVPWFADFLSPFVPAIGELGGYRVVNLPKSGKASAEAGLKYGNNEVCYPSTLILGDIINALQSGNYDLDNCAVAMTQTGGQCRATNYLAQIKSGLKNAGFAHIPVIAITSGKVYQNEQGAFDFPLFKFANIIIYTLLYADALQQMFSSTVVKEREKGETQALFDVYVKLGVEAVTCNDYKALLRLLKQAVADFNAVEVENRTFGRIGLVGEIYVKYNSYGQAHITEWLRGQGMEVITPPILDFLMQYFVNSRVNTDNGIQRGRLSVRILNPVFLKYMTMRINHVKRIMQHFRYGRPAESIFEKAQYASEILDLSNQFGEGWSIAAEVACHAHNGINKVVCIQPFGCIANHVVAKGIEKRLKKFYPGMNLLFLDIDGGMAEVNLQNRLHFMIAEEQALSGHSKEAAVHTSA
ncbi:MAG: acyl-CoA dehydratase activase-related protein [Tannerella sp.]|jgi:predicted CoA-substrate-specific enzyme activase|nr:acyl-CoA dehydratase activase-related protein [Tannerella sp.]